jgi:hypothetical protein
MAPTPTGGKTATRYTPDNESTIFQSFAQLWNNARLGPFGGAVCNDIGTTALGLVEFLIYLGNTTSIPAMNW